MRSAEGLAALFLEDATIVTEWGDVVKGRALFASGLTRAFANPQHSRADSGARPPGATCYVHS